MPTNDVLLDLDDIEIVAGRAAVHLGVDATLRMLGPAGPTCCRAAASERLFLRRYAAGSPEPGIDWSYLDHLHLIDAELARMGASPEAAKGCGRTDCPICSPPPPPTCPRCGRADCPSLLLLRPAPEVPGISP